MAEIILSVEGDIEPSALVANIKALPGVEDVEIMDL